MKLLRFILLSLSFNVFFSNASAKEIAVGDVIVEKDKVDTGVLHKISNFPSQNVPERDVHIWLPDGYSKEKRYAVLYMHDGQMLFDATTTWNKQEWAADEVAGRLMRENKVRDFIIVGIFNGGPKQRHNEYFPQRPLSYLSQKEREGLYESKRPDGTPAFYQTVNSDAYLRFLVSELKPYIDSHYSVETGRENTFIMGSSMGGLISMYAISEYPDVFGGAACLSTHWPGGFVVEDNPIPAAFYAYIKEHLPAPKDHKIYFDYGDATLDAFYPPLQKKVDGVMKEKGYDKPLWETHFFKGADHSENSWRKRLHIPMTFLLKK